MSDYENNRTIEWGDMTDILVDGLFAGALAKQLTEGIRVANG